MNDSSKGHCISDIMLTSCNTLYFKMDIFGVGADGNQHPEREKKNGNQTFLFFGEYLFLVFLDSKEVNSEVNSTYVVTDEHLSIWKVVLSELWLP